MKIDKVLNNNVVVALDRNGTETVLMGRGLAFGRHAGDPVPAEKVEKRFTLHSDQLSSRFQQLLTSIPLSDFLMSERIINHAKLTLGKELSDSIYVTLPDHISAAVQRYQEGLILPNPLLWDIRQFYKDEYQIGLEANRIVQEETGIQFAEDEAGFIALHFVNAQVGGEIRDVYDMTYLMQAAFRIVRDTYGFEPDCDTLDYFRFVTHLKFFCAPDCQRPALRGRGCRPAGRGMVQIPPGIRLCTQDMQLCRARKRVPGRQKRTALHDDPHCACYGEKWVVSCRRTTPGGSVFFDICTDRQKYRRFFGKNAGWKGLAKL